MIFEFMRGTRLKDSRRIKGILFDFDGTLTSPGALDFPAIKQELGCPPEKPILEFLETQPAPRRAELMKILDAREEKAARKSLPNDGAEKSLLALKRKGLLLGIITRNSLKSVTLALERFRGVDLEDFSAVITREDALPKPHPHGVHQAARQMGIRTSELMVVGDFRFDVMAGKAAGACTVLLTNAGESPMIPGDPEPDYVLSHLEGLLEII